MKTQILSILAGAALAMSLSAVQATESLQATEATGEAGIAAQVETLPQEMLAILGDVSQGEFFLMEEQEMEASVGTKKRGHCGKCCPKKRGKKR